MPSQQFKIEGRKSSPNSNSHLRSERDHDERNNAADTHTPTHSIHRAVHHETTSWLLSLECRAVSLLRDERPKPFTSA